MTDSPRGPVLALRDLTIDLPHGRRLLEGVNFDVADGEFVLLVGPSGSGKTTLLKLIAAVDDGDQPISVDGRIEVGGGSDRRARLPVGLVFQNHALFDEFSATLNVRFALDHRPDRVPSPSATARELLANLGVPVGTPLSRLSGGERQRVAVARTLAMNAPLMLFDEPTTGLDPVRARAVTELITQTHQRLGKTVVVVTHDYKPFLVHRPRLVLLDSDARDLREVTPAELETFFGRLQHSAAPPDEGDRESGGDFGRGLARWIRAPGEAAWMLGACLVSAAGGWRHPVWKLRYLWHYVKLTALGNTAIYVAIAGAMLGFVFTSFSFAQLPYEKVTVPLLTEELLAGVGYATYRVIVPLLISVLIAGKCGAAVAADVGTRRLTHQFEAMRSFGARPSFYLYGNVVIALLIGAPLLNYLAYLCNSYAALVAYLSVSEDFSVAVFERNYFATLWPEGMALPKGTWWVLVKTATSGLLVAAMSYLIGSRPKISPTDVSRDVGLTIFWATLAVLTLHSIYSFVEF